MTSIAVWALAYCTEDHRSGPIKNQWLEAHSLATQQQMGTRWKHWGDKGGEEMNWSRYLTMPRTSILSNRHPPPSVRIVYGTYFCTFYVKADYNNSLLASYSGHLQKKKKYKDMIIGLIFHLSSLSYCSIGLALKIRLITIDYFCNNRNFHIVELPAWSDNREVMPCLLASVELESKV